MHLLIVGGTGMLEEASRQLARGARVVTLVARRPERLTGFAGDAVINRVALDYRTEGALAGALRGAVAAHGPVDLAVTWIHEPGGTAEVIRELARARAPYRLFHIRGSAAAAPDLLPLPPVDEWPPECLYRQVILGFTVEGGHSRWLSHQEISQGVLEAVAADAPFTVVGTVRPWSMRP